MIVITGGAGYIGKNIAYYFLTQGEKVVLLDNFYNSSCESLYELFKTLDEQKISRNNLKFFNIGTEKGTSVKELIHTIEKVKNIKINNEVVKKREGDLTVCFSNSEKAKKLLNWQPEYTLEQSIETIRF